MLEKEPLETVTQLKEIQAFKHEGFWQCMDHKLDKDYLEELVIKDKAPWIKMKSLLVIGGTGFIGYHVISEAKKRI